MLESIEIVENFDDLNETQKYQLKVPLFRNNKQYITELENNVNFFMNQVGKNNYITDDQMEVVMPRYVQKEKKQKRVNRARAQADKVRKEIDNLKREEKIYGKATFKFANDLPVEIPRIMQPSFSIQQHPPMDLNKAISTEEYKNYKYQYKPYVHIPTESSRPSLQAKVKTQGSGNEIGNKKIYLTDDQQETLLMEKSSAYLLEQSKIQDKWQSSFKNLQGINSNSNNKQRKVVSQDNLIKNYKETTKGILSYPSKLRNIEPSEEELFVSNNNLEINDILINLKLKSSPNSAKTPENYIFQEFIQLAKQSSDILQFNSEDATSYHKPTMKEESKKLNLKLLQVKKDQEKFLLVKVFKNHFQPILEKNKPAIMTRIFLALDINPHEDYSKISWKEYFLFNKIVVDQNASVIDAVNFLVKFFGIQEKKYMRTIEFIALLRLICNKFDEFLITKGRSTIFELLEQNFTVLGLLKPNTEFVSLSELRALLLAHRVNHETILQLIITNL